MEESRTDDRQQFMAMFDSCVVSPMSQVIDFPERWRLTDEDLTYVAGRLKQLAYRFDELARRNWRVN